MSQSKISFIIPVYNEELRISDCLRRLGQLTDNACEIIVVDGGSTDSTIEHASQFPVVLLTSDKGRGIQLAVGARTATGDIIAILHADSVLPSDALMQIRQTCNKTAWGRFNIRIDYNKSIFRLVEKIMNMRSCLSSIATGDQVIFMSQQLYREYGMPEVPLMEDIALSKLLKKHSRCVCVKSTVTTSARYWVERGVYKIILKMWYLRMAYFVGVSPEKLYKLYYEK